MKSNGSKEPESYNAAERFKQEVKNMVQTRIDEQATSDSRKGRNASGLA